MPKFQTNAQEIITNKNYKINMLGIIFLSMILVNTAKITFLSPDISCDGFKRKYNVQILSFFFFFSFCIGNEFIVFEKEAIFLVKGLHHIALVFCRNAELWSNKRALRKFIKYALCI